MAQRLNWKVAGRQGFEPRYADPESAVLPLNDLPAGRSRLYRSPQPVVKQVKMRVIATWYKFLPSRCTDSL